MQKCFHSSYNVKIIEIIVLLLACNTVVIVKNVSSENLISLLFFWNIYTFIIYFLIKLPLVRSIEFANDGLIVNTLFNRSELKYNQIEMRIIKYPLRPLQEKILLKARKKKFTVRKIDWEDYGILIECLKTNIENKYE